MEKLGGLIISEGDWDTVLVRELRDVFGHVNVFSTRYLPSVVGITSPTTCRVSCDCSPKYGMDNVLRLPDIGPITWPRGLVQLDLAGSVGYTCRGEVPLDELS